MGRAMERTVEQAMEGFKDGSNDKDPKVKAAGQFRMDELWMIFGRL